MLNESVSETLVVVVVVVQVELIYYKQSLHNSCHEDTNYSHVIALLLPGLILNG